MSSFETLWNDVSESFDLIESFGEPEPAPLASRYARQAHRRRERYPVARALPVASLHIVWGGSDRWEALYNEPVALGDGTFAAGSLVEVSSGPRNGCDLYCPCSACVEHGVHVATVRAMVAAQGRLLTLGRTYWIELPADWRIRGNDDSGRWSALGTVQDLLTLETDRATGWIADRVYDAIVAGVSLIAIQKDREGRYRA